MRKIRIINFTKKKRRFIYITAVAVFLFFTGIFVTKCFDVHPYFPDTGQMPLDENAIAEVPFVPAEEGVSVFIDLDIKKLTLFENGTEVKSWPVSGGSKESPSPIGNWKVVGIGNWGEGFGGSWIAINVPFGKYGIHGTVEPWAVGNSNISHGCIRMKNKDVGELKKHLKYGVPVVIKHDDPPFRVLKDGKFGSDVVKLQAALKEMGYYEGNPDGRFGAGTKSALMSFQKSAKIKADGIYGWHAKDIFEKAHTEFLQNGGDDALPEP